MISKYQCNYCRWSYYLSPYSSERPLHLTGNGEVDNGEEVDVGEEADNGEEADDGVSICYITEILRTEYWI